MATKLLGMVTYSQELPPIELYELLIMWFCEAMWQIKYVKLPLAEELQEPSLARCKVPYLQ